MILFLKILSLIYFSMPIILFTASSLLKPLQHLLFKIEQKEQFPLHPREVSIEIVSYIFSGIKSYAEYNVFLSKVILSIKEFIIISPLSFLYTRFGTSERFFFLSKVSTNIGKDLSPSPIKI